MPCGRTITDGPNEDLDRLALILAGAVSSARERVRIMTPYFLPSRGLIGAMQSAALRGVAVDVILPLRNNLPFMDWATRNMLWELLERGIRVFYQPPPFAHSKLFVVDDQYGLIGSPNIDPRSLRLNFELAVEIYDRQFCPPGRFPYPAGDGPVPGNYHGAARCPHPAGAPQRCGLSGSFRLICDRSAC